MRQHPRAARRQPHHPPQRPLLRPSAAPTRPRPLSGAGLVTVEEATEVTTELAAAFAQLVPQLSRSAPPPSPDELAEMIAHPGTTVFVARDGDAGNRIVGTLTLVLFRIPTGLRAWIEDVIVDEAARGRGVGERLSRAAIDKAREAGARTLDLTSRPSREAANRLYARIGFTRRDTNVYRLELDSE